MKTTMLDNKPMTPGTCEWCGNDCNPAGAACSLSCEAQMHRLEAVQGRMVLRILKRWRMHSGRKGSPGEGAFSEVTAMVDRFRRNDRLRREEMGQQRRQQAVLDAAATSTKAKPKKTPPVPAQTAAPVVNQPEEPHDNQP